MCVRRQGQCAPDAKASVRPTPSQANARSTPRPMRARRQGQCAPDIQHLGKIATTDALASPRMVPTPVRARATTRPNVRLVPRRARDATNTWKTPTAHDGRLGQSSPEPEPIHARATLPILIKHLENFTREGTDNHGTHHLRAFNL